MFDAKKKTLSSQYFVFVGFTNLDLFASRPTEFCHQLSEKKKQNLFMRLFIHVYSHGNCELHTLCVFVTKVEAERWKNIYPPFVTDL